jgi:chromosome segregation ATPase
MAAKMELLVEENRQLKASQLHMQVGCEVAERVDAPVPDLVHLKANVERAVAECQQLQREKEELAAELALRGTLDATGEAQYKEMVGALRAELADARRKLDQCADLQQDNEDLELKVVELQNEVAEVMEAMEGAMLWKEQAEQLKAELARVQSENHATATYCEEQHGTDRFVQVGLGRECSEIQHPSDDVPEAETREKILRQQLLEAMVRIDELEAEGTAVTIEVENAMSALEKEGEDARLGKRLAEEELRRLQAERPQDTAFSWTERWQAHSDMFGAFEVFRNT